LAALASGVGLCFVPQRTLRWDRQQWWVASGAGPEQAGELSLAIDLGGWLLLRFQPEPSVRDRRARRRPEWIALQRRGLEADWHVLRCTIYASRPPSPRNAHLSDV
jgi:hypothetical protein